MLLLYKPDGDYVFINNVLFWHQKGWCQTFEVVVPKEHGPDVTSCPSGGAQRANVQVPLHCRTVNFFYILVQCVIQSMFVHDSLVCFCDA